MLIIISLVIPRAVKATNGTMIAKLVIHVAKHDLETMSGTDFHETTRYMTFTKEALLVLNNVGTVCYSETTNATMATQSAMTGVH